VRETRRVREATEARLSSEKTRLSLNLQWKPVPRIGPSLLSFGRLVPRHAFGFSLPRRKLSDFFLEIRLFAHRARSMSSTPKKIFSSREFLRCSLSRDSTSSSGLFASKGCASTVSQRANTAARSRAERLRGALARFPFVCGRLARTLGPGARGGRALKKNNDGRVVSR
jgi:hypothetical protein